MAVVTTAAAGLRAAPRATILQLRNPRASARELEREALALVASSPVPVVVSSRCDIALAARASGVNLPEHDIGIRFARDLLGDGLVGRSVHSLEAARRAQEDGADYIVFGPVWPTASHPDMPAHGVGALAQIAGAVRIPVLAIGGVTEARIAECRQAGAAGYASIRLFA